MTPSRLAQALRRRSGNVSVMAALLAVPLLGAVGMSVDMARGYVVHNRLVGALDAAALAGGRVLGTANVEADIRMYFRANIPPGFLGASIGDPQVTVNPDGETLSVKASATLPTVFMGLFGRDTLSVSAENKVRRTLRGLELSLVLDVTGSMWSGDRIGQLRASAKDLVNILFGPKDEVPTLWISVVPYTATVNLGPTRTAWLDAGSPPATAYGTQGWRGCVEARVGNDSTDTPPAEAPFRAFLYPNTVGQHAEGGDNDWPPLTDVLPYVNSNERAGPNLGCGPPVLSLTNKRADIIARIDTLRGVNRGGTMANIGLQAGWFTLSPRWRGLWGTPTPAGMPLNYGLPDYDKAIVLLTDGSNEWFDYNKPPTGDYTAYGRLSEGRLGTTNNGTATTRINSRMTELCTAIKAQGIRVYTITLAVTSETTRSLYRSCASQPGYYFNSPTAAELRTIFQQIGTQLSSLRLER